MITYVLLMCLNMGSTCEVLAVFPDAPHCMAARDSYRRALPRATTTCNARTEFVEVK